MLPFFLDCQKRLGITERRGLLHVRECLPQLVGGVGEQRVQRALVRHGDNAALNSAAKQIVRQLPPLVVCECARPALRLELNVGKHLGQRFEFDEAVEGKRNRVAVF